MTEPWRDALSLRLYGALMHLAQPLLRRKLARRARTEPGYAQAVPERFGHYTQPPEPCAQLVWVHAVSLGETRAAGILLKAWRAQQPDLRVLLTHGTATGRAEGLALLMPGDVRGLAKALRKLMADEELRAKLGTAAQRRFEERFNPDRVMGEILEVYREAVLRAEVRRSKIEDREAAVPPMTNCG